MSTIQQQLSVSAYAAPNTPIASAKRPRRSPSAKKDNIGLTSPIQTNLNLTFNSDDDSEDVENNLTATNLATPMTPSKILFSPNLNQLDKMGSLPRPQLPTMSNNNNDDDDEEEFNPYLFMAQLPNHATTRIPGKICLPPKPTDISHLPTLVLDLDETLVHCTVEPINNADLQFPVLCNNTYYQIYVRKRPYLDHFLEIVAKHFEIVLFTASQKIYADTLLNLLDPEGKYIHHRLFRDACLFVQGNFLKDLSVLNRDLKSTLIIDNSPHAYGYQVSNGIPIESWFDDDNDEELLKAINFLSHLISVKDVRPFIEEHFRTHELIDSCRRNMFRQQQQQQQQVLSQSSTLSQQQQQQQQQTLSQQSTASGNSNNNNNNSHANSQS